MQPAIELILDNFARRSKPLSRVSDKRFLAADRRLQRPYRGPMKRISALAVFRELNGNFITAEVNEVSGEDFLPERFFHDLSVVVSDAETDQSSDVSKNGLANLRRKLIDELMRKSERKAILARLRE